MTDREYIAGLRIPTREEPLKILMSACLAGTLCGYDGTANGEYPAALKLLNYSNAKIIRFCPEEFSFGSPREMCDIDSGDGFDVLDGKAQVITESGRDWTSGMIKASEKMLGLAKAEGAELAVLMDISAACGSQVIYNGNRFSENKKYIIGAGVCAAQLIRNGIRVISQRDFASLELLYNKLDKNHVIDLNKKDHHETEWYINYFNN